MRFSQQSLYSCCRVPLCIVAAAAIVFQIGAADSKKDAPPEKIAASWGGDLKIVKYHKREFIVGVRNDAIEKFPLIGSRTMDHAVYADSVFPMTIQTQVSYSIYDSTKKQYIVFNVAECLKDKDVNNSEKTDWAGTVAPWGANWKGDILVIRKYDKKGPGMRAPYYSMGRDYPMQYKRDGSCVVQYNYFGDITFSLKSREVDDELLAGIIDSFDKHYHPKSDDNN